MFYEPFLNCVNIINSIRDKNPEVIIVNKTKITREVIDSSEKIRCIIKYGSDLSTIDTEYCSQKGIFIATCNGQSSNAVAELTLGLIIAVNRRILDGVEMLHAGYWAKDAFSKCTGLKG